MGSIDDEASKRKITYADMEEDPLMDGFEGCMGRKVRTWRFFEEVDVEKEE